MKRILFVAGLMLIAGTFTFGQEDKLKATLIQMDKDWTAAELKGDTKTAGTYVADDFWETTPQGDLWNKTQYLADLKPSKDTDRADEYSVRFFGKDVAVMTHRGTVKGERSFQYRSTHVWVNRGGKWQIVAHHSSEIAAPAKISPSGMSPSASDAAAPTGKPMPAKAKQ